MIFVEYEKNGEKSFRTFNDSQMEEAKKFIANVNIILVINDTKANSQILHPLR